MSSHLDSLWQQAEAEYPDHFGTLGVIADALEDDGSELAPGIRLLIGHRKSPLQRDSRYWMWYVRAVDSAHSLGVVSSGGIGLRPADWSAIGLSFRAAYEAAARDLVDQSLV